MLTLILASLIPMASAQSNDGVADLEAAPAGCWGDVSFAVPDMNAEDVPLDIAPRFHMDGQCTQDDVFIELRDADGAAIAATVDASGTGWGTSIIVRPDAILDANSDYTLFVSPDFGSETELAFSTGIDTAGEPASIEISRVQIDGWCEGRAAASYSAMVELTSDTDGFHGFVTGDVGNPSQYQPILIANGSTTQWAPLNAELGDDDACVFLATISDTGELSDWTESCAALPDVGTCRQGLFRSGCGREAEPVAVPREAALVFGLLPLIALRRRKQTPA